MIAQNLSPAPGARKLLVSAFGIHMGGGLVLLRALMSAAQTHTSEVLLDERVLPDQVATGAAQVKRVARRLWSRLAAQTSLVQRAGPKDVLLCFNSLPPLLRCKAHVVNYVHAAHFVGAVDTASYVPLTRLRLTLERLWFRCGVRHCDEVWVQTDTMRRAMQRLHPQVRVRVVPLVDELIFKALNTPEVPVPDVSAGRFSFFYPADAVGHKNHPRLLSAWKLLADQGIRPRLLLTLRPDELATAMADCGLNAAAFPHIENLGRLSRDAVLAHLAASTALLFPSQAETFGLPMLEARLLNKPILASERDFVRDVCTPVQTFDPDSSKSIARAVARFVMGYESPASNFFSPSEFVEQLLACAS